MNRLVEEAMRNPFEGIDKPGPLKGDRKGYWSRRITDERRFIYKSKGSAILECIKMCLWWKDFYERLQPVVSGATTVREAVEAVEAVTEDAAQPARVRFGGSEDRCKTPVQMLKFGRGACGELSMTFVYSLRAVDGAVPGIATAYDWNLSTRWPVARCAPAGPGAYAVELAGKATRNARFS